MGYLVSKDAARRKRLFDEWITANYDTLKEKCIYQNLFGEVVDDWQRDIFHNTYLAILDLLEVEEITDFENVFISSFQKYCRIALRSRCKEIVPDEIFWKYQRQREEEAEEDENRKEAKEAFAAQILFAAKVQFSRDEYQIFKLHFESGFSFRQIGEVFGTTGAAVLYRYNSVCGRLFGMFNNSFNRL